MKAKRILSLLLAVSLVLTCAVAGIVLPAAAESTEPADLLNGLGSFNDDTWKTSGPFSNNYWKNCCKVVEDPTDSSNTVLRIGDAENSYIGGGYLFFNNCYNAAEGKYNKPLEQNKAYTMTMRVYGVTGIYQSNQTVVDHNYEDKSAAWGLIGVAGEWKTYSCTFYLTGSNINWYTSIAKGDGNYPGTETGTKKGSFPNELTAYSYIDDVKVVETQATAIAIEQDDVSLAVGESNATATLTVAATPAKSAYSTVVWTSSNPAVATVDAETGVVTAVGTGTATITATAGALSDSVTVKVINNALVTVKPGEFIHNGDNGETWAKGDKATVKTDSDGTEYVSVEQKGSAYTLKTPTLNQVKAGEWVAVTMKVRKSSVGDTTAADGKADLILDIYGLSTDTYFNHYYNSFDKGTGTDQWFEITNYVQSNKDSDSVWINIFMKSDVTTEGLGIDIASLTVRKVTESDINLFGAGDFENGVLPHTLYGTAHEYSSNIASGMEVVADPADANNKVLHYTSTGRKQTYLLPRYRFYTNDSNKVDKVTLKADTIYKITYRQKGTGYSSIGGSATKLLTEGNPGKATTDWQTVAVYLKTPATGLNPNYTIDFNFYGDIYFDDFAMYEVGNATGFTVTADTTNMTVGGASQNLTIATVPAQAYPGNLTITSSDACVTVSGTTLTAGKPTGKTGTATIMVTSDLTDDAGQAITGSLDITVSYPVEHFVNGSMDDSTEGITFNVMGNNKGAVLSFETSGGVDDSGCLKVSGASAASNDFYFNKQTMVLRPNSLYKVSMMVRTDNYTNHPYVTFGIVSGNCPDCTVECSGNFTLTNDQWKECVFWVRTGDNPSMNSSYNVYLDIRNFNGDVYFDNFSLKLVEDSVYIARKTSTSFALKDSNNADVQYLDAVAKGTVIKMEVIPNANALLLPGNLTYTDIETGKVYKVLNKKASGYSEATFGTGDGHQFEFTKPSDGPGYFTVTSTTYGDTNYRMNTAGTSLRYTGTEGEYDGIRFLTRLTMRFTYNPAEDATLTVTKDDTAYTVVEFGTKLKRKDAAEWNDAWTTVAYKQGEVDTMKLLDYCKGASWCPSYIDFAVTMKKGDNVSTEAFEAREYTACGYLVLQDAEGNQTTVYSESELTNSVANAKAAVEAAN